MKKRIILFLIMFASLVYSAYSLKVFEINETDKLSLGLKAEDPDADKLAYTFTKPLDDKGEWQTSYGDAGEYKTIISVSDGVSEASEEVLIIVHRKEEKPVIDIFEPQESLIVIGERDSISFSAYVSDLNNDKLSYTWLVNGKAVSGNNEFLFETNYKDAGDYIVKFAASDSVFNVSKEWNVKVNDVNIQGMLDQIKDVTVLETEKASLGLPDLKKYGLSYEVSEPLGNKNIWQTGYDDAGEYTVKIKASGNGFEGEKDAKVTVKNKDRAPDFIGLNNAIINENEQIKIKVNAIDADGDKITLSAEGMPQDAKLEENVFTWTPSYDFVQKNNGVNYLLDKFRILSRSADAVFKAKSNDMVTEKKVKITVKDVNRAPILEVPQDIEANEGQDVIIGTKYSDPDNDKVSVSYSGFMDSNKKSTGYDDSGIYIVKVTATDGFFTETKFVNVKVNNVNRKPVLEKIGNVEVKEGEGARIELKAADADNDAVRFSAKNMPEGAVLRDNIFVWKPGLDTVNGTKKEFSVDFIASDGVYEESQKAKITVVNVNQAPKITGYSDNLIAERGKPILFEINAIDPDGDNLTHNWDFGFFDKFKGENKLQRVFTSKGEKTVKVTVSDGLESVSKVWNVQVV